MEFKLKFRPIILLLQLLLLVCACGDRHNTLENVVPVDSICSAISGARYSSIEIQDSLSAELSRLAVDDNESRMIATNTGAYVAMMDMDYGRADDLYSYVLDNSRCAIERLVAAVGMMTVDYRVSANRQFFDHRNVALGLINRINEDVSYLSQNDYERFMRAKIEFGIVSICYFANLGMLEEKELALSYLTSNLDDVESIPLRVYARMILANNNTDAKEHLSSLLLGLNVANSHNLKWLQANYKLLLAITLRDSTQRRILVGDLPERYRMFPLRSVPLDSVPMALALEAKNDFKQYGDQYMMIESWVVAASCDIQDGYYDKALALLDSALVEINGYYRRYYPDDAALSSNVLLDINDADFVTSSSVYNIPECLLSVRREASRAYAGLRDKSASDINREAYLGFLRTTRMNKKLESRTSLAEEMVMDLQIWLVVLVVLLLVVALFVFVSYASYVRHERNLSVERKRLLDVCRRLISSLPHEVGSKTDICNVITGILNDSLGEMFGKASFSIVECIDSDSTGNRCCFEIKYMNVESRDWLVVTSAVPLSPEKLSLVSMAVPYIAVAVEEGMRLLGIDEEQERVEEQRKAYALYLAGHKRENLKKRVSMSVVAAMRPFMDRLLKELRALPAGIEAEDEERKLRYINELTCKLDDLNVILERWIKMRKGELSLHVENFMVSDLFAIIRKSCSLLDTRGITLDIAGGDETVKADKALTLFMINTLVDNASKFTPSGGKITVGCESYDRYVEIYVSDTGIGLSHNDIESILGEKVYEAARIGEDNERLQPKSKGGGFGLMNCKGIIEKYRKTDEIFSVCSMDIASEKGKGSRFSFRLPKGVVRVVTLLFMLLPSSLFADNDLFTRLRENVDSVYMSNVNGNHEEAFVQAEKVLSLINSFYMSEVGGHDTLTLYGGDAAELSWWREGVFPEEFKEDIFFNILDMRNEVAVASLAMSRWQPYRYNNDIYTILYRLVHEDAGIVERYESMQERVNMRQAAIALLSFVLLALLLFYLMFHVRFKIIGKNNERMVTAVNERLLHVVSGEERISLQSLAESLLHELYTCMGENMRMKSAAIVLCDTEKKQFMAEEPCPSLHGRSDVYMYSVLESGDDYISSDGLLRVYSLFVTQAGERHPVGVLEIVTERPLADSEIVILDLVVDYLASVAYHAMVRVESRYLALEEIEEETERMKYEEGCMHVKNLVMDNCLSVIKHETIYYPSRVRELACKALASAGSRCESVAEMCELMEYYSSIFGILSNCAMRELDDMSFSLAPVALSRLFDDAARYLSRCCRKNGIELMLCYEPTDIVVNVDYDMVLCLFESLLDASVKVGRPGTLLLRAVDKGDFARVELVDERRILDSDEMADLFVPTDRNITSSGLDGMEYLVAKEVVRLHEDYTGKYGGRMEARSDVAGTVIVFTLPK